jgi:hypothetical protein
MNEDNGELMEGYRTEIKLAWEDFVKLDDDGLESILAKLDEPASASA